MHGIYLFRVTTNDIQEALGAFMAWIDKRGDENNWFEPLCAINKSGHTKLLASKGDWRGRDATAASLLREIQGVGEDDTTEDVARKLCGEATISDLKIFAWKIVVNDVSSDYAFLASEVKKIDRGPPYIKFERGIEDSFKINNIELKQMPKVFLERMDELIEEIKPIDTRSLYGAFKSRLMRTRGWFKQTKREKLPFIRFGTPYDFRAFDLDHYLCDKNSSSQKDGETVFAVDIHT